MIRQPIMKLGDWVVVFGDHIIARATDVGEAMKKAIPIVDPTGRNVRIVSPRGFRMNLLAASLLL